MKLVGFNTPNWLKNACFSKHFRHVSVALSVLYLTVEQNMIRLTGSQRTGAGTQPHSLDGLSITTRDCGSRATTPMRVASGFTTTSSACTACSASASGHACAISETPTRKRRDLEANRDRRRRRRAHHGAHGRVAEALSAPPPPHHGIHCPEEALGLSKPEPTREEPVPGRPHQATRFTLDLIKNPDRRSGANLVLNKGEAGYFTALANLLQSHPSASRSEGIQNDLQTHPRIELCGRRCFVQR
jgi:hypothetical protein